MVYFKTGFQRSFKKLSHDHRKAVQGVINSLLDFRENKISLPAGLGLKHIGKDYWEIRAGIKIRVIFEMDKGDITFYFVGDHNDVRRFIRQ